jgi:Bacterial transglutaminase-like N-terminal region
MTILTVRHITTYQYKQPVSFGEHRMMLQLYQVRRGPSPS